MERTAENSDDNIHWLGLPQLQFDPGNPRLSDSIDGTDDGKVFEWMLRQGDSIELIASIGATGYSIAEPLLVVKAKGKNVNYIVVEGNRRLAALKLLSNPELAPIKQKSVAEAVSSAIHKPVKIPVIKYKSREEAFAYLGYRHIAGIKPWGPLQKARYVQQLYNYYIRQDLDPDAAIRKIATVAATKPYIAKRTLTNLAIYDLAKEEGYWNIKNISSSSIEFSVLGTAFNYNEIVDFVNLSNATDYTLNNISKKNLAELFEWLFAKVIGDKSRITESRQLKVLAKVVATPAALKAFRSGVSLQDAGLFTDEADESFQTIISKAHYYIEQAESLIATIAPSENNISLIRKLNSKVKLLGLALSERKADKEEDF